MASKSYLATDTSLLAASTLSHFHTAAVSEEGPKVAKFLDSRRAVDYQSKAMTGNPRAAVGFSVHDSPEQEQAMDTITRLYLEK